MIDPVTGVIIFVISGTFGVATHVLYEFASTAGPSLELGDLRPMTPVEGPPLPLFIRTKPELLGGSSR